jgi:hypothetical protein
MVWGYGLALAQDRAQKRKAMKRNEIHTLFISYNMYLVY